jgi:membrane-associated phospholipid phosphatase
VTLLLGVIVHGRDAADGLDRAIDPWLHQSIGRHRGILNLVSLLGTPIAVAVLAAALVVACLMARRRRAAGLVLVAVLAASALTEFLLKPLVGRGIRDKGSFPSGHAAGVFALAVAVCVLFASLPRWKTGLRRLLSPGALLVATAVSVAMVGMGHHYFTDIIGGAAVGTAMVLLTAFVLDWIGARQWPAHDPAHQARIPQGATRVSARPGPVELSRRRR